MSRTARSLGWFILSLASGLALESSLRAGQPEPAKSPAVGRFVGPAWPAVSFVGPAWPAVSRTQPGAAGTAGPTVLPEAAKSPADKAPATKAPGGIIISRETTFITGPLRKDGSVDYLAALNERYACGVTPENNAAVLLLQAIGPKAIDKKHRARLFTMLGMTPLPEHGPYLEPFTDFFQRKSVGAAAPKDGQKGEPLWFKAYQERERIMERPWSRDDSPIAAAWLHENQKQLDLLVAATKRPRFYVPIVAAPDDPEPMSAAMWLPQEAGEAARGLCARAMFRIAAGRPEDAWQDLLACHRLARLLGQRPTLLDGMVAQHIDGIAVRGDAVLAHESKLTPDQARRFARDFNRLAPLGTMAEKLNAGERFFYLDGVESLAKRGPPEYMRHVREMRQFFRSLRTALSKAFESADLPGGHEDYWASLATRSGDLLRDLFEYWIDSKLVGIQWILYLLIDWNEPMRLGNECMDRVVAALSKPTRVERDAALAKFETYFKKAGSDAADLRVLLKDAVSAHSLRVAVGRAMGRVIVYATGPAYLGSRETEGRGVTQRSVVRAVFALAAYRADHGVYPPDLAALVPKYLPTLPEDAFCDDPLSYKRVGVGYVLYSVGPKGKDDFQRIQWYDDGGFDSIQDPLAIQVPAKKE